jgi:type III secretory pathway component EscT
VNAATIDATVAWLLATLRVLPAVVLLPTFMAGAALWPLRVATAGVLALGVSVTAVTHVPSLGALPHAIVRELLLGTSLALWLALPFVALDHAARLWNASGAQVLPWAGAAAFLAVGGHHGALRTLAATYTVSSSVGSFERALRATAEALAGGLVIASAVLVAQATIELLAALVSRIAWPVSREAISVVLTPLRLVVAAIALRACAEIAMTLAV